jgi:hypothetical protein
VRSAVEGGPGCGLPWVQVRPYSWDSLTPASSTWGGVLSALIGTVIVLVIATWVLRRGAHRQSQS